MSKSKRPIYFTVSVILVFLMAFLLPIQVFAETIPELLSETDSEPTNGEIGTANIVGELKDLRDEYSKQFRLDDGSFLAVSYETPIHYKDENGNWVNYNNSLIDGADAEATPDEVSSEEYTNKSSDFDVKYSKKSKDNNMVKVKTDDYMVSWGYKSTNKVKANVVKNDEQLQGNEKFTALRNLTSEVLYENVYDNVDIQYITNTVGVKENIILKNSNTPNEFFIQYKFNKLTANLVDDRTIELTDKSGKVEYSIEAPYMVDAKGQSSTQLSLSITEQKNSKLTVKISVDRDFLKKCEYPVTIDPTFNTDQDWENAQCTYADSAHPSTAYGYGSSTGYTGTVYAGTFGSGMYRSYIKMESLPTLKNGDMIVDAKMNLHLYQNGFYKDMYVNAYYISESWNQSTLTWNNKPSFESNVVDYEKFKTNDPDAWHDWNVTTCVKRWYNGESNNGIMLKVPNESTEDQCASFYSANYPASSTPRPVFTITYRNNKGLEDYWTYSSFSVGTAGTAYINDYSGNLVFVSSDASTANGYSAASVQHIYNGYMAGEKYNKTKPYIGNGWRMNIQQTLFATTGDIHNDYPYVYTDEDGTEHYFYKKGSKYLDEDGLGLELVIGNTDDTKYIIKDDKNNKLVFKKNGRLSYTRDSNNNAVKINYDSSDTTLIKSVRDASANLIKLELSPNSTTNYLRYIKDPSNRTTEYNYDSGNLVRIIRPNGKTVEFEYATNGLLKEVKDVDGYRVRFGYASGGKVSLIREIGASGTEGQRITFERTKYNTTIIGSYGADGVSGTNDDLLTTYQFDQFGRTKSIKNNTITRDLGAKVFEYTDGVKNSTASNIKQLNRVSDNYSTGSNAVNLVKNGNLESTNGWTKVDNDSNNNFTATSDSLQKYFGKKSLKINVTNYSAGFKARVYQDFGWDIVEPGSTYTLSGYIKTTGVENASTNAGAMLYTQSFITGGTPETFYSDFVLGNTDSTIDNGWQRVSVTFTVPDETSKTRIYLALKSSTGSAYFDGIQLEKYSVANNVNLIENSSLDNFSSNGLPTNWSDEFSNIDFDTDIQSSVHHHGYSSFRIKGDNSTQKSIIQTIPVSGSPDDTYIVSGWAKANAVPEDDTSRRFRISIKINYTDGTTVSKTPAKFNCSISDWQYTSIAFNLRYNATSNKTPTSITISLRYHNQANYAYFDDISLIKDNAQSYTYDSDGNLINVVSNSQNQSTMEYTNSDLTKCFDAKGYKYEYEYDSNHNMTYATSQRGVDYNYIYEYGGLATGLDIFDTDGVRTLKSRAAYDTEGHLYATRDVNNSRTTYEYDDEKGLLNSCTDSKDTTYYTYDSNTDLLTEVNRDLASVNYTYSADSKFLKKITHNATNYNLTYDQYGNKTNSKVGTQSLASYTYNSNNGAMTGLTYGNGQTISYTYDHFGNETSRKYNGTTAFTWNSDRSGSVVKENDILNKIQYDYTYDTTGRLVRKSARDTNSAQSTNNLLYKIGYGFDLNNNVTSCIFRTPVRGTISTYTYGKDNLLNSFDINSAVSVSYNYDKVNRLKKASLNTTTPLEMSYTYGTYEYGDETLSNNRIVKEVVGDTTYRYEYDGVGNITKISETKSDSSTKTILYTYDELNQLKKVVDNIRNVTYTYSYDDAGNLLSENVKRYDSSGNQISSETNNYSYNDSNWKDKLTTYNGTTITYDAIGNPLSYRDGITFTWKNGRQLNSYNDGTNTVSYKYGSDSVRTKKIVNGVTSTYAYENGLLMYETRGDAKFYYSYDTNGVLYAVKYTANDNATAVTHYYAHNSRGDITAIYNGAGNLEARYEYDSWGNVISVTNAGGTAITNPNHIGNLNPFRYRGYYYDTESRLYYLMSRYYDSVTHRFVNIDGYFQTGEDILGVNMSAYCGNNPVNSSDPTGQITWKEMQWNLVSGDICLYSINDVTRAQIAGYGPEEQIPFTFFISQTLGKIGNSVGAVFCSIEVDADLGVGFGASVSSGIVNLEAISKINAYSFHFDIDNTYLGSKQSTEIGLGAAGVDLIGWDQTSFHDDISDEDITHTGETHNVGVGAGVYLGVGASINIGWNLDYVSNRWNDIWR